MQIDIPITKDLVLVGGGHTHALVLKTWGMSALPGARVTLINPMPTAPYTGMLPGFVAGHYTRDELDIDLVKLSRFAGARFVIGAVHDVDIDRKVVSVHGRPDISYDVLSVDIGISSSMPNVPGFAEYSFGAKPLGVFADAWEGFIRHALEQRGREQNVVVIGGGVAGVELAMAMAHRMATLGISFSRVVLLEASDVALGEIDSKSRSVVFNAVATQSVQVRTNARVRAVTKAGVELEGGEVVAASFVVGAAGAAPQAWLAQTRLELSDGFICVNEALQSVSSEEVFAVGDCANMVSHPRPKAGVFAVRQAPVLVENLRAALCGSSMSKFRPQKDYLKLISTGGKSAIAHKFGRTFKAPWMWKLKDHIDRKFMRAFEGYPEMLPPDLPRDVANGVREVLGEDLTLCGGCGAKIEQSALQSVLRDFPAPDRDDVVSGPGDDAAILTTGSDLVHQVLTTDHLRGFVEDPWMMGKIAAVHALGDIWAMGGKPQAAVASIVLPRMSEPLQTRTLREIMSAARTVFTEAGADVVGGHSSVGAELTIGFSVTGLVDGDPITVAGAKPGDALVLTQPIGSGVLSKAEMLKKARGAWMVAVWESMMMPQGAASEVLAPDASAMTDVTGFGLAGHLMAILKASAVGAQIQLNDVPLYDGAIDLSGEGVRSSLWQSNRDAIGDRISFI